MVQIHEFSTGIKAEGTANGGWISQGFTEQYLNQTLPEIPYTVQQSILNKEFAVAEGVYSDTPAIVARVVPGDPVRNIPDWSVLALVTCAQDEFQRSLSVYRYFLCEGRNELRTILAWITHQTRLGKMPVFNPFEVKVQGQPNEYTGSTPILKLLEPQTQKWLLEQSLPIVLPKNEGQTPAIFDEMATQRAKGQPIAWAFNVEALEQPDHFIIILASDEKARQLIIRSVMDRPRKLKFVVKGLINGLPIKPELVQTLLANITNERITKEDWHSIFDGRGAVEAITQGIYTLQMARLLTLRAIAIPETLPEYLRWLNIKSGKKNFNQLTDIASTFQAELSPFFSLHSGHENLLMGLEIVLLRLLERKILVEEILWLLKVPKGLWTLHQVQLIKCIETDLEIISRISKDASISINLLKFRSEIWSGLIAYWKSPGSCPKENKKSYEPFSRLFKQLKEFSLSAYFTQVSCNQVPKHILIKCFEKNTKKYSIYGLKVIPKYTFKDSIYTFGDLIGFMAMLVMAAIWLAIIATKWVVAAIAIAGLFMVAMGALVLIVNNFSIILFVFILLSMSNCSGQ